MSLLLFKKTNLNKIQKEINVKIFCFILFYDKELKIYTINNSEQNHFFIDMYNINGINGVYKLVDNLKIVSLTKHFIHFLYNFCKNVEINHILEKYESSSSNNFSLIKKDKEKLCDFLSNFGFDGVLSIKYPEIIIFNLNNTIKQDNIVNLNYLISNKEEEKSKKRKLKEENQQENLELIFKKIKI